MQSATLSKRKTFLHDPRDAADEVMANYKSTLDKINGARDKTEYNI